MEKNNSYTPEQLEHLTACYNDFVDMTRDFGCRNQLDSHELITIINQALATLIYNLYKDDGEDEMITTFRFYSQQFAEGLIALIKQGKDNEEKD